MCAVPGGRWAGCRTITRNRSCSALWPIGLIGTSTSWRRSSYSQVQIWFHSHPETVWAMEWGFKCPQRSPRHSESIDLQFSINIHEYLYITVYIVVLMLFILVQYSHYYLVYLLFNIYLFFLMISFISTFLLKLVMFVWIFAFSFLFMNLLFYYKSSKSYWFGFWLKGHALKLNYHISKRSLIHLVKHQDAWISFVVTKKYVFNKLRVVYIFGKNRYMFFTYELWTLDNSCFITFHLVQSNSKYPATTRAFNKPNKVQ